MTPILSGKPAFVMLKLQQHAGQSAKCIKSQSSESGKQTQFQTVPGALDLPAMPVFLSVNHHWHAGWRKIYFLLRGVQGCGLNFMPSIFHCAWFWSNILKNGHTIFFIFFWLLLALIKVMLSVTDATSPVLFCFPYVFFCLLTGKMILIGTTLNLLHHCVSFCTKSLTVC